MKRLVAILTAASLSAHMLLGCCFHHAHASAEDGHQAAETAFPGDHLASLADVCHPCDAPHAPGEQQLPERHCSDVQCSFARSAGWHDSLASVLCLTPAATVLVADFIAPATSSEPYAVEETALVSVSLHQLRQILLI